MSKMTFKKTTKPLTAESAPKQSGTNRPIGQDLNSQQQRRKKTGAAEAQNMKSPAPAATPKLAPTPPAGLPKPLTPLAAAWPNPALPPESSQPLQTLPRKAPASGDPPKEPTVPSTSPKPSTPLAAPASKSVVSQAAVAQVQKTPAVASGPKPSLPPATPSPRPAAQLAPEQATEGAQTPTVIAPKTVQVSLALSQPGAKRVSVCGEFNGWSPDATPMKSKEGGRWETVLALKPGRYQYKFIVDGQWVHDPNARQNVPNPHGSLNSVVEVRA